MNLRLCFSPCPNDTFIFDAMVHSKIDTEGLTFDVHIADVEELNLEMLNANTDIGKLSYHAYAYVANRYVICNSGSALGRGNGPLLVSKYKIYPDEIGDLKVAIPGKLTTAAFLLNFAFPSVKSMVPYLFSDIEEVILSNEVDAGVLIHETRFTYQDRGLKLITDLGKYWEEKTTQAIPLGGIVIRRDLPKPIQQSFNRVLLRSIKYALENPRSAETYIKQYSQNRDNNIIEKHIEMFVNEFTVNLGNEGKNAVLYFLKEAQNMKIVNELPDKIFIS